MRADQAKTIPIDRYLEQQGFKPERVRQGGRKLWYKSPIRDGDSTPSFKVDAILNLWYDHSLGRGGNVLDLAIELQRATVSEALAHLERTRLYSPYAGARRAALAYETARPRMGMGGGKRSAGEKEKSRVAFELVSEKPLKHPALLQYLQKRRIDPSIARAYLSQIDFKAPQSASTYFALGYPAGEGFEARNALFKGFVGTGKNISVHEAPDADQLLVFEGFMDFLSYLTIKGTKNAPGTVIVLNSTALRSHALPYLADKRYRSIRLYLDNDDPGDEATQDFLSSDAASRIEDMRAHYADFDDLNAYLMAR